MDRLQGRDHWHGVEGNSPQTELRRPEQDVPDWPQVVGACLFAFAALVASKVLAQTCKPSNTGASPVTTGLQMRRCVAAGLLVASCVRCMALSLEVSLKEEGDAFPVLGTMDPVQLQWAKDLVALLPAVLFLSAFSIVVFFWVQLHYTATIVPLPLLDCFFICVNIACYLLITAVAVGTFLLRAYGHLRTYLVCIIGFLNAAVAMSLAYYGLMVASELTETAARRLPGRLVVTRVAVLSVACPLALLVRAAFYLASVAWGLQARRPEQMVELALCVGSEWLPTIVALAALNPLHLGGPASPLNSLEDSSEEPLLSDETPQQPRTFAAAPGATWKQIYPQP